MDTSLMNSAPLEPLSLTPESKSDDADIFVPEGVCPNKIHFVVEDDKLASVDFTGGCDGNLKAISQLLQGMPVEDVIEKMSGITCGKKSTSCVDQLSKALAARSESGSK